MDEMQVLSIAPFVLMVVLPISAIVRNLSKPLGTMIMEAFRSLVYASRFSILIMPLALTYPILIEDPPIPKDNPWLLIALVFAFSSWLHQWYRFKVGWL